nr:MAG TPA: Protein of unknown function (DUF2554) [Caudoviricetes sp.]
MICTLFTGQTSKEGTHHIALWLLFFYAASRKIRIVKQS